MIELMFNWISEGDSSGPGKVLVGNKWVHISGKWGGMNKHRGIHIS